MNANQVITHTKPGTAINGFVVGHYATMNGCKATGTIVALEQSGSRLNVRLQFDTPQKVDWPEGATGNAFLLDWRNISSTWMIPHVLYSPNESALSDGRGFWSNTDGWVEFDQATKFTHTEKDTLTLPLATGQDAKWILWSEADMSYGGEVRVFAEPQVTKEQVITLAIKVKLRVASGASVTEFIENLDYTVRSNTAGITVQDTEIVDVDPIIDADDRNDVLPCGTGSTLAVSLDGGVTYCPAREGVRIIYHDVMIDGEDEKGELHINATHEGVITDLWANRSCDGPGTSPSDFHIGGENVGIDVIVSQLVEEND